MSDIEENAQREEYGQWIRQADRFEDIDCLLSILLTPADEATQSK